MKRRRGVQCLPPAEAATGSRRSNTMPVTSAITAAIRTAAPRPITATTQAGWSGCHNGGATSKKTARPAAQAAALPAIQRHARHACRRNSNHCAVPTDPSMRTPAAAPAVIQAAGGQPCFPGARTPIQTSAARPTRPVPKAPRGGRPCAFPAAGRGTGLMALPAAPAASNTGREGGRLASASTQSEVLKCTAGMTAWACGAMS